MMRRGVLVAVPAVLLLIVLALTVDRSPVTGPASAGFGLGPVTRGIARTDGWRTDQDLSPRLAPTSSDACSRGDAGCLDDVVAEMTDRLDALGCTHAAVFAYTYLQMTEAVRDAVARPGFFAQPPATVHLDALFARLYFDASDNWQTGRRDEVTGAWQIAFGAAERPDVSPAADMLLGMNAHIARDLPYAVAMGLGLDDPPGTVPDRGSANTPPPDFLRVNDVIASVKSPMLHGAADRFGPSLGQLDQPLPALAGTDASELIGLWRTQAYERGLQLATAPARERPALAQAIDRDATATAVLILNADQAGQLPNAADRDAYCAAHRAP